MRNVKKYIGAGFKATNTSVFGVSINSYSPEKFVNKDTGEIAVALTKNNAVDDDVVYRFKNELQYESWKGFIHHGRDGERYLHYQDANLLVRAWSSFLPAEDRYDDGSQY
jgi:hypothetical protein